MKLTTKFDPLLIGPVMYLLAAGLLILASIDKELFIRQLIWAGVAIFIIFGLTCVNLRSILSYRWIILLIYFMTTLMLVITYFIATPIAGTKSWISFGWFQLQPSEFMKVALVILFSKFFASRHVSIAHFKTISMSFIYVLIPIILVLIQPDLGTALVILGIWFGYLLVSELPLKRILIFIGLFLVIGVLAWNFGLVDYQKARILALFDPSFDPLGVNYSVIQSKIAIGSAGFFGKGFGQGTQVQLGFLPASHTDFIFAAFVEEWGLLGGLTILLAFTVLIYRILTIGLTESGNFYKFITLGTVIVLLLHLVINLGSTSGLFPVVGVSLPFVSYGGSNLLTLAILVGIIHHIAGKRAIF